MILINGIYGSGKSFLCERIKKKSTIPVYSASQLIAEYKNETYSSNKFIDCIDDNQHALIEKVISIGNNINFILDGHLCLLNDHGEICRIDNQVVMRLNPKLILTKISDPNKIYQRLKLRDNRDYDIDLLDRFQKEEIEYAKEISLRLKIRQLMINDNIDEQEIIKIIRSV